MTLLGIVVECAPPCTTLCGVSQISARLGARGRGRTHPALSGAPTADDECRYQECDQDDAE